MMEREDDQPLLRAEELSKWYGKQLGCRDVSFALYPGEVIAVVGESGSGKTTLFAASLRATRAVPWPRALSHARWSDARSCIAERGGTPLPVSHRLGLRASRSRLGSAHGGVRGCQCRRAADGDWLASLRPHPRDRGRLARPRRDRWRTDRRCTVHLLGRDASAAADRAQSRHPAAPRVHGRADRRPRCFGSGAPARSAARTRGRTRACRGDRDARPCRRTAVISSGS